MQKVCYSKKIESVWWKQQNKKSYNLQGTKASKLNSNFYFNETSTEMWKYQIENWENYVGFYQNRYKWRVQLQNINIQICK